MAKQVELAVNVRTVTGKATKHLRQEGVIPANIFGRGEPSQAVQVPRTAFENLRRKHSATGVIALKVEGKPRAQTVLIRHVQREPCNGNILHIDFFRVGLRDRIAAKIPLNLTGVASGAKVEGGVLLHLIDALEVECTAGDIVEALEVDISGLEHIDDILHAKDVPLPPNYTLLTDAEEAVVKITPPRVEKAEAVAEAPAAASTETASENTEVK